MAPSFSPPRGAALSVRIADTTSHLTMPLATLMTPSMPGFDIVQGIPSWSFLIEHSSGRKVLFDLGVRKDWENMAPLIARMIKKNKWGVEVEKNVIEVLEEGGVKRGDIEAIVWSHFHWDHLGDPSTFPPSTDLIVGPGFTKAFLPAYPRNQRGVVLETDFAGRNLREISFESGLKIGAFDAEDYFSDGSFYLLSTPGHTIGHISGLARTSTNPDTFIFMGGDLCHHGGELRPSKHLPIPNEISPNPFQRRPGSGSVCPGAMCHHLLRDRGRSVTEPFFDPNLGHDIPECIRTIQKTQEVDADENVFFISAHDDTIEGVVDLFPKYANDWKAKGWAAKLKWAFLRDFKDAIEGSTARAVKAQL